MIKAYEFLKNSSGFKVLDKEFAGIGIGGAIQRNLFNDYFITFVPDEGNWNESENILVYLSSIKFSEIITT